jgi:redox-sensitive bicupin YhaK (pirin superfamily)
MKYRTNAERGYIGCSRLGEDNYTSRRSFDFEGYQSGIYLNWGPIVTINDDTTKSGFETAYHEHKNLDILSYVVKGKVKHHDNLGNDVVAQAGQVQHMSCGTSIWHTESNPGPEDNRYLQIWIASNQLMVGWEPKYTLVDRNSEFELLPLELKNTRLDIRAGILTGEYTVAGLSYLLQLEGSSQCAGYTLSEGDSLEITGPCNIESQCGHLLLFTMT